MPIDFSASQTLLLRTGQVARLLNMHTTTVSRLVQRGELKVYARTPGGHALFQHAEVMAYRASLLVQPQRELSDEFKPA